MTIQAKSLTKKYNNKLAVDSVSLSIEPGKILGLLGPNGAGKSTTIKMLSGQLKPTNGEVIIDGKSYKYFPEELRSKLGIMPQEIIIWDDLNIKENLEFTAQLYKLDKNFAEKRIKQLIQEMRFEPEMTTLARNLSGGYKRRLNLAVSIIHDPEVIFLDEPSPGIDPQSRLLLTEYIQSLADTKKYAIVLTDHYLDEAEKLSDYVVIIDEGKVVAEGTVTELKKEYGSGNFIQVDIDLEVYNTEEERQNFMEKLQQFFPDVRYAKGSFFALSEDIRNSLEKINDLITDKELHVMNVSIKEPSLEDIFLILTGKDVRE